MIYWRGINIDNWVIYPEIAKIKSAVLFQSEHAQWHVAQNRQLTFHRQICQILLSPINHLVCYMLCIASILIRRGRNYMHIFGGFGPFEKC